MVPRVIRDADLKINIPKIKYTFEKIKLTCALKNIFGCNPYPKKFKYHSKIEEAIVALNKAMKFDLCIIDGNIISGAKPRKIGLVMASKDPVAIDAAAAKIAGINPKTRAIIPVHYGGQPCDMKEILEIAEDRKLHVVEDCAHSLGAEYKDKKQET